MAFSFQEQHPNFLLDSVYLPKTPVDMLLLHQAASSCFSIYPYSSQENDLGGFDRSCFDTGKNATYSAERQLVCSPILMPESNVESKRKSREEESFNTDQSKDGKGKKKKRVRGGGKEIKKPKSDEVIMEGSKARSDPTAGYIHVRARRGQATDSHSLAERVRREKISERMKMLQGLVPGCERVTGKALMLDEIINYVQSLQNQVEFLSMKIASLSPILYDFNVDFDDCINQPQYLKSQKLMRDMPQPLPSLDQSRTFGSEGTNYQVMDHAPALLLQGQGSTTSFSQDGGSSLQVDAQRQVFLDQLGFTNMCSFQ